MSKEARSQRYDCLKKGHIPMDGIPFEIMVLESYPHVGRVCRRCKMPYFEQISDKKIEELESGLVDPKGKVILSDV